MSKIEIKSHPKTIVVGLIYHGKNAAGEIPQLWGQLMQRAGEVQNRDMAAMTSYGVSIMPPDYAETMVFDYIAGFPVVEEPVTLPEGMVAFDLPAGTYAVVACPDLASLPQAYEAIYERWLPTSDYGLDLSHGNFCFELYGEEFNPPAGSEKLYIYVPVKRK